MTFINTSYALVQPKVTTFDFSSSSGWTLSKFKLRSINSSNMGTASGRVAA